MSHHGKPLGGKKKMIQNDDKNNFLVRKRKILQAQTWPTAAPF